jgi:hypothetical protein
LYELSILSKKDVEIISEINPGYYLIYTDKDEIYNKFKENKISPAQYYYKAGKIIGQGYIVKKEELVK